MLALEENSAFQQDAHIRRLNLYRDLHEVANLIEICFADQMDADGKEYLRQLRRVANDARYLQWAERVAETSAMPFQGLVWEQDGKIIGNLNLVPLRRKGRRVYLIANVAVHPDHRRGGIARALTESAVEASRKRGAWMACLQVREDNPGAHQLYEKLGFVERARRTTWQNRPGAPARTVQIGVNVTGRYSEDWHSQQKWFKEIYPEEVAWNLPLKLERLKPGFVNEIAAFFNGERGQHWAARLQGELIGVLSWQPGRGYTDNLWLAASPRYEEKAVLSLLPHAQKHFQGTHLLALNYPAGRVVEAIKAAGFNASYTLIWMEMELN